MMKERAFRLEGKKELLEKLRSRMIMKRAARQWIMEDLNKEMNGPMNILFVAWS